jgi:hypothetical protein
VDGSLSAEDLKRAISVVENVERKRGRESYSEEKLLMDVICGCSHKYS